MSISDLFQKLSVQKTGDPIRLVCELYKVFKEETESQETLDDFYFWGELLISDFDDVDKNLVDADKLFSNLQDLKSLMDDYEFLDKEQEEAIQQFFRNFSIERRTELKEKALEARLEAEAIDVTIPGTPVQLGHRHPMNKALDEAKDLFISMGFRVLDGPEVELADYNFTRLNIAENHPSRDRSDTFYITDDEKVLLRTQTSPMQIRAMDEIKKPPIRILAPGRVYRKDEVDATHSPMFHQIEGLVIDKGVTMADLKGTLETLIKAMYGEDSVIRFRPHHFPFTEPSCEVDVQCFNCRGKGCPTCKGEGWIELLGAGMVHPKVLEGCGIDPSIYSGFAFGIGLERMAMRRFQISDLRMIFENDIRFLSQF